MSGLKLMGRTTFNLTNYHLQQSTNILDIHLGRLICRGIIHSMVVEVSIVGMMEGTVHDEIHVVLVQHNLIILLVHQNLLDTLAITPAARTVTGRTLTTPHHL